MKRLGAFLRHVLGLVDPRVTPLLAEVADLRSRLIPLEEAHEAEVERDLKWAEMNAQLRRYLGRLDAHAGRQPREQENGHGPRARADVIAAKYPGGLPTKE